MSQIRGQQPNIFLALTILRDMTRAGIHALLDSAWLERRTKGRQNEIISFQEMQDAHELKMRQMNALLEQKKDRCYELQQQNKFLDAAYVDEDITILEEKIVKVSMLLPSDLSHLVLYSAWHVQSTVAALIDKTLW